jgi:2-iminobutanoate/2-iminopropanoate deaminase
VSDPLLERLPLPGGDDRASSLPPISAASMYGSLVVVSGQAAVDLASGELLAHGIVEQTEIVLDLLENVLERAGASLASVLRAECYLARRSDFASFNDVFARRFPPPRPARTTVVCELAIEGMLVEVQALAARR